MRDVFTKTVGLERGVEAADEWLRTHAGQLGVRSTLDLERAFA